MHKQTLTITGISSARFFRCSASLEVDTFGKRASPLRLRRSRSRRSASGTKKSVGERYVIMIACEQRRNGRNK